MIWLVGLVLELAFFFSGVWYYAEEGDEQC